MSDQSEDIIRRTRAFAAKELKEILRYWIRQMPDQQHGGFIGRINGQEQKMPQAVKGGVLNARILWTFSAAYQYDPQREYLEMAQRSFDYLQQHFVDLEYGGVYWSLNYSGEPQDSRKQIYHLAFTLYGLSAYYAITRNNRANALAAELYLLIEKHSLDRRYGGYFEAFNRDWSIPEDMRLSEKDQNDCKTMNTHLHILEAYTAWYQVSGDERVRKSLFALLETFKEHIIDLQNGHLRLFFDEQWQLKSDIISYGHDIEAAWLLLDTAETVGLGPAFRTVCLQITDAARKGIDTSGGMNYECNQGLLHAEKHWWVQAEAMVGLFNAWQLTGEAKYLDDLDRVRAFTEKYIIDHENGEWFWGVDKNLQVMEKEDKAGFWKCPYHNSRACVQLLQRTAKRR